MHPYYPALRRALAGEIKGANQPRRVRLLALNRDRVRVLPRGTGDYILVNWPPPASIFTPEAL